MAQLETIDLDLDDIYEILTNHVNRIDNPHRVKPADINLENVDNTSDKDKPVSDATQAEIDKTNTRIKEIQTYLNKSFTDLKKDVESKLGNIDDLTKLKEEISTEVTTRKNSYDYLLTKITDNYTELNNLIDITKSSLTKDILSNADAISKLEANITVSLGLLSNTIEHVSTNLQNAINAEVSQRQAVDNEIQKELNAEIVNRKKEVATTLKINQTSQSHVVNISLLNTEGSILSTGSIDFNTEHILQKVELNELGNKLIFTFDDQHQIECSLTILLNNLKAQIDTVDAKISALNYADTDSTGAYLGSVSKTLTRVTQTNGKIATIYSPIQIDISQVTNLLTRLNQLEDSLKKYSNDNISKLNYTDTDALGNAKGHPSKTITKIVENEGIIEATYNPIAVDISQVNNLSNTLTSLETNVKNYTDNKITTLKKNPTYYASSVTINSIYENDGIIGVTTQPISIRQEQINDIATQSEVLSMLNEVFGE